MKFRLLQFIVLCITTLPVLGCGKSAPYLTFKKIGNNIYETTVSNYDYDYLLTQRYTNIDYLNGGCSAIRKGNYVGRNFDFVYGDIATLIVRTPHTNDRLATIAVTSGFFWFTNDAINKGIDDSKTKILPLCVLDGINEKGVMVEINCVNAADVGGKTTSTNQGAPKLSQSVVVRYLLDHATSADNAISLLREKDIVSQLDMDVMGLTSKGFEVHFLISDSEKSYVVELDSRANGTSKMVVLQNTTIMTNFYLHLADIPNGTYSDHAVGVERYKKLVDNQNSVTSLTTCKEIMESIRYSNSNRLDGEYDPALKNGYTCYSDHPEFGDNEINYANYKEHIPELERKMIVEGEYTNKFIRGEVTENPDMLWCTCFTSCYDLVNKCFDIALYERYNQYYHFDLGTVN